MVANPRSRGGIREKRRRKKKSGAARDALSVAGIVTVTHNDEHYGL